MQPWHFVVIVLLLVLIGGGTWLTRAVIRGYRQGRGSSSDALAEERRENS